MTIGEKITISDDTKLTNLTVGELKAIIRGVVGDLVEQAVFELEQQLPDPDAGKEFKPEFAAQLRQAIQEHGDLKNLEEVKKGV